jgi:hypothetical protein
MLRLNLNDIERRFKPFLLAFGNVRNAWPLTYEVLPVIQVQTLSELMEINSFSVNDLTGEHSRECEGRKGIQKLEFGQNISQLSNWLEFYNSIFCSEIRDFCYFEDIILSAGVPVSDPQNVC